MTLNAFAHRVSELVPRVLHRVWVYGRNLLSRGLITLPQMWALDFVAARGGATLRELAQAMGCRASTATALVDRLEAMGLVRRGRDSQDRRVVRVKLSAKGRRVLRQMADLKKRMVADVFRRVTARDREAYLGVLEKLAAIHSAEYAPAGRRRAR